MANRKGKVEPVTDFICLGSKITVDSDCSHEIKRHLLLVRKAMTNLDSVLKNKNIIFTAWITTNWKILQEVGVPDHLTCLLRNLYAGQEATVRTEDMEQQTDSK